VNTGLPFAKAVLGRAKSMGGVVSNYLNPHASSMRSEPVVMRTKLVSAAHTAHLGHVDLV